MKQKEENVFQKSCRKKKQETTNKTRKPIEK